MTLICSIKSCDKIILLGQVSTVMLPEHEDSCEESSSIQKLYKANNQGSL